MDTKSSDMQDLNELTQRVASVERQITQLRDDVRDECSATREGLRKEMHEGDEALRQEIRATTAETIRVLRHEIREGDEETRRLMRVLHEDLVARIDLIQRG